MRRPVQSEVVLITPRATYRGMDLLSLTVTAARLHGATAVWIRQPEWPTSEVVGFVRDLRCELKISIWIGRDILAACEVNADALLLPSSAPQGRPSEWMARLGYSVHGRDEALERWRRGADFVVFGPIRDTIKRDVAIPGAGIAALRDVCAIVPIPVIAVGGLCTSDLSELESAGASGFAAIRSLSSGS